MPATSQITTSEALSSTSIWLRWSAAQGADSYLLVVERYIISQGSVSTTLVYNQSFTALTGRVEGLSASTRYSCLVEAYNGAGHGARGRSRIVSTRRSTRLSRYLSNVSGDVNKMNVVHA